MSYELGVQVVPIDKIRPNIVSLRQVDRKSAKYLGLVDSIKRQGFLGTITARPKNDETTGADYLELIDGLHRYSAARDAGLDSIKVDVVDKTEDELLEAQLMMNFHKIETLPAQYAAQLRRILDRNPLMTEAELADKLGVSFEFIQARLSLNKIDDEEIRRLVDEGKIKLYNAYQLAKLPTNEMRNYLDLAMTEQADQFAATVAKRRKEINEANRKGEDAPKPKWEPSAFPRKPAELKSVLKDVTPLQAVVKEEMTPMQAAVAAIKWVMHLDEESVAAQLLSHEQKEKANAERKKRMDAEKAAERAKSEARKAKEAVFEADIAQQILVGTITSDQAVVMRDELKAKLDAEEAAAKAEAQAQA